MIVNSKDRKQKGTKVEFKQKRKNKEIVNNKNEIIANAHEINNAPFKILKQKIPTIFYSTYVRGSVDQLIGTKGQKDALKNRIKKARKFYRSN